MSLLHITDGDILKYAIGFACEREVFFGTGDCNRAVVVTQKKGKVWQVEEYKPDRKAGEKTEFSREDLPTKDELLEHLLGISWESDIVAEPDHFVKHTVKQSMQSRLRKTGASDFHVYLSKGDCFRVGVYPEYKANRLDMRKPIHYDTIQNYLIEKFGGVVYTEIEADDACGIMQCACIKQGVTSIIDSLDKDIDMIPGLHYNATDNKVYAIDEETAMRNFWKQCLTGDTTDNIPGIKGIGKVKAAKIIDSLELSECKEVVLQEYDKAGLTDFEFERNAQLLWILRKPLKDTYGKTYEEFFV